MKDWMVEVLFDIGEMEEQDPFPSDWDRFACTCGCGKMIPLLPAWQG